MMSRDPVRSLAKREEARRTILEAALEEFGSRSFSEATTSAIALRAGVSKGLVFNYFPTKEALLQALVERTLSEVLDFWDAQRWDGPPREQLRFWIDAALNQVVRRPGFYRLYFSLALQPGGSAAVNKALLGLQPRLERYLARVEAMLKSCGSADPPSDARLLQCAINGLAQVIVTGPDFTQEGGLVSLEPLRHRLMQMFSPAAAEFRGQ
jgi:AcrR family transcriptional regulator